MRIVIDMQGAQSSGSRNRGIGRYTKSLTLAIAKHKGDHEIILALSGLFPDTIESIRADFEGLIPQSKICVWYAPKDVNCLIRDHDLRRKKVELLRESFLAGLNPDIVLVTSLFEGGDDAVTSIGLLGNIPTAVILYDLIPWIYSDIYLSNKEAKKWYLEKLDHIRRSELILSISESSRQEGIDYLGIPKDSIVNISTAADSQFHPQSVSTKKEKAIRKKYDLNRPFVMYTGGIDHRKNIEGLIRSYAKLPKIIRNKHELVIVCSINEDVRANLKALAKEHKLNATDLVLTGFVPEEDLIALYALCKLFVFPTWHEGFGLPALEAMSCGRATIGSNQSSVPEVIGLDDALFDSRDDDAITEKMLKVLTDDDFRTKLEKHGLKQAKNFTWDKTAIKAISSFENYYEKNQSNVNIRPSKRPKLAFISPLPPASSGISDYSAELLSELTRHYEIDVIVDQDHINDSFVEANCKIRHADWFKSNFSEYDRAIYHFGNSSHHQYMFDLLELCPGVVVLHDLYLSGIQAHLELNGMSDTWSQELYKFGGYSTLSKRFLESEIKNVINEAPCNSFVFDNSLGLIFHSQTALQMMKNWYGNVANDYCDIIPLLRTPSVDIDRDSVRASLDIKPTDFVICTFGVIHSNKMNHRLLNAWLSSNLAKDENCILVFVGDNVDEIYSHKLSNIIRDSGLSKRIRITNRVDKKTYKNYLSSADMGVQLRDKSHGETSAAVLDCMNYGLPTIVNKNGSMAELDDKSVWKIIDNFTDKQLVEALESLWEDSAMREKMGEIAKTDILHNHSPRYCANQYFASIEKFYQKSSTGINALISAVSAIEPAQVAFSDLMPLAEGISRSIKPNSQIRQLLVDVSDLMPDHNASNEILEMSNTLKDMLSNQPAGFKIEPVYVSKDGKYYYARRFTLGLISCHLSTLVDEPIEHWPGDMFMGLFCDLNAIQNQENFYQEMRNNGVLVEFFVSNHSLLLPEQQKQNLFNIIIESDGVIYDNELADVAMRGLLKNQEPKRVRSFKSTYLSKESLCLDEDKNLSHMLLGHILERNFI